MSEPPPIGPPPPGPRPFWSVMIPTYEPQPEYLTRALDSLLEQAPGAEAMEIVLVDDGSTRIHPRTCVRADARERVAWIRQERHGGIGRNWNACIARARGEWVHLLHQDDLLRPGFYARLREGIESAPQAGAAFCRDEVIDGRDATIGGQRQVRATAGIVDGWIDHLFVGLHLRASALVVRRNVYQTLGGFRQDLHYALDWDMWKRIAAAYPLWYEPAPLACYRRHPGSATSAFVRSGANIAEIRRSIELSEPLLSAQLAASTSRRARVNYTHYAAQMALQSLWARDLGAAWAQLREGARLTSPFAVGVEFLRLLIAGTPIS